MLLEIITPEKKLYSGETSLVQVPGSKGQFAILENHCNIISTLDKGKIKVVNPEGSKLFFDISSGVIEVKQNKVVVLAETI
jgi:F-type H+-transporting ATPase subunit epsilon